jgi:hypothetical protein
MKEGPSGSAIRSRAQHLLAIVAQKFPELTEQEFLAALQVAIEQSEKHVVKR